MAGEGVDIEMEDHPISVNDVTNMVEVELSKLEGKRFNNGPLLQWKRISVIQAEKKVIPSKKMQDMFVVYNIETRVTDKGIPGYGEDATSVWRRYSEFELLRNYLEAAFPWAIIPPLPEKKQSYVWQNISMDRFSPGFVERRRRGLEIFLIRCAAHPQLCQDKIFLGFLEQEQGWKETVNDTDFYAQAESRLKSLNAQFRLKKLDSRFEDLKNYSTELQSNIGNILKIRAHMCDKLYGIHKVHGNYARVFTELSVIEKHNAEHFRSAGQYLDDYASAIDAQLEETEQFADHLKEYKAFGDSLRSVCRRYECAQYDVERNEDSLANKNSQREALVNNTGRSGFSLSGVRSKLFGPDTPEQREVKLKQLDEQIMQTKTEISQAQKQCEAFVDAALRDIDRFQRQKTKDLQEVMANYALLQVMQCKYAIAAWTGARDSFSQM